jgi:hypothetical protein
MQYAAATVRDVSWGLGLRIAFRFVCSYLVLFIASTSAYMAEDLPGLGFMIKPYMKLWHALNPLIAIHLFHVTGEPATYFQTGSGDTTLAYVEAFSGAVIAAAATLVWSILDRRRLRYHRLYGALHVLVRYELAAHLTLYAFYKIFPLQFRFPNLVRLMEPLGEFSPMGVLWNFMGASPAYTVFSGAAEMAAALLLFWRRTATLGAMLAVAVMLNVAALNYCYDVPVKLFSTHLLLMALFLLAPEARRVAAALLPDQPLRRRPAAVLAIKVLVVGYILITQFYAGWSTFRDLHREVRPPLYGLYDVEQFVRNGEEVTDSHRWRKVAIAFAPIMVVRTVNDERLRLQTRYDRARNEVTVNDRPWTYARTDAGHVELRGQFANDSMVVRLRAVDPSTLALVSRGFHWIQEYPFQP